MVEQKATVPSEIPEVLIVLMGFISHFLRLLKGSSLGGLVCNADVIEVNRMIELILYSDDHDGIVRDFLIHGEVNTQKESNDDQADENDSRNFPFLTHRIIFRSWFLTAPPQRGFSVYKI